MGNATQKAAVEAEERFTGRRFCPNCQQSRSTEGGRWVVLKDGVHRRWLCGPCRETIAARKAGRA
jgi:ribosomal protein S27AE